ncbi:MAG: DUF1648 domain-containing protein [Rhodococcus sp.]|nr:DUF1648 domain-containing protein [Rhodococcus sp. (in: high G+C Gram-positive bacteria)]
MMASIVPLLALAIAWLLWDKPLPDTVATHWSGTEPDGFSTTTTFLAIVGALCVVFAATAVGVTARTIATGRDCDSALWLPTAAVLSWTFASAAILSVSLTIAAGSAEEARLSWWIIVPLLSLAWGAGTYWVAPKGPAALITDSPKPENPIAASESAVWIAHVRNALAGWLAAATAGAALLMALIGEWWLAPFFVLLTIFGGMFASVTVQVDGRGLSLRSWGIRWRTISLDSITHAGVIDVRPAEWGGWGYRLGVRGTAVVVRAGEAIALERKDARPFVVTVDGAATGAALLNDLGALATD